MTLLGAIQLEKSVLFGADGVYIHQAPGTLPAHERAIKIVTSDAMPSLAMGFAGAVPWGVKFREWFKAQSFASWDELERNCAGFVAECNRTGRSRAVASGLAVEGYEALEVLVGGYIDGASKIIYFDDEGGINYPEDDVLFVGAGPKSAVFSAWYATTAVEPDHEKCFRAAIEGTIEAWPMLSGVQFLEVKP